MILPGQTIGIMGAGQLGRMSALAARAMGYRVVTLDPSPEAPAAVVADTHLTAAYDDPSAWKEMVRLCDVITTEFENVPEAAMAWMAKSRPVRPAPTVLGVCQNRAREKQFLLESGLPHAAFAVVDSPDALAHAAGRIGYPCVLKTASFGYDGKGQKRLDHPPGQWDTLWREMGGIPLVVEEWIHHACEVSVIVARTPNGEVQVYPVFLNEHRHHILDLTLSPAPVEPVIHTRARALAEKAASALHLEGILAVEFFVERGGRVLVNELAPRPHNSGHLTIEACPTSQFQQHIRAVCGLPLGATEPMRTAGMLNLLGDLWERGTPPWARVLAEPRIQLHLYGKAEARVGRKMGHLTVCTDSTGECRILLETARKVLFGLAP